MLNLKPLFLLGSKILGGKLEVALWVGAYRADFGSLLADHDVTAV